MKRQNVFLISIVAVTAITILLIFTDWLPVLRGPAPGTPVWSWLYVLRPVTRWGYALLAAFWLIAVLFFWLKYANTERWRTLTAVSALAIGSFLLQFGILYADHPAPFAELVDRTLAVQTSGYFWTAANIDDLNSVLLYYPDAMTLFESDHARTHPPGLVVANWLTIRVFEQFPDVAQSITTFVYSARPVDVWLPAQLPAVAAALGFWALLPILLAAIAVFPAYALAKMLLRKESLTSTNVILAMGFIAAIPALTIFAPMSDQIFAFLTLCIMLALYVGLQNRKPIWLFIAGILFSFATFFSVGNAALLVPIFIVGLLWQDENGSRLSLRTQLIWATAFCMGALSIWIIYWVGWHIPPWQILQTSMSEHYEGVTSKRSYRNWFAFNFVDLMLFSGLPAFISFGGSVWRKKYHDVHVLALGTAVLIAILIISGSTRGEVGRIWLFFMPLIALSGGLWVTAFLRGRWRAQWLLFILQLGMVLAMGLAWKPIVAMINP